MFGAGRGIQAKREEGGGKGKEDRTGRGRGSKVSYQRT